MSGIDLLHYVKGDVGTDADFCDECWDTAWALVRAYTGEQHSIPENVLKTCVLQVGANLYRKRGSQRDQPVYGDMSLVAPSPLPALDPLTPVKPILNRFMKKAF